MKAFARVAVVAVAFAVGALLVVGSLLAALLEGDAFTSASANGPRPGYIAMLAVGLAASVLVPFGIALYVFPESRRQVIPAAVVALALSFGAFVAALV